MRVAGVAIEGVKVNIVILSYDDQEKFTIDAHTTLTLQAGETPNAYNIISGQFSDFISQNAVEHVCIKGSAVTGRGAATLTLLKSAELRGVIQAAAAATGIAVNTVTKSKVSKEYGERNMDDYVKDDKFWAGKGLSGLKKGDRGTALFAVNFCENLK